VRCAPPANQPTPAELAKCAPFFSRELQLLEPKVILALGAIGWNAVVHAFALKSRPKFAHAAEAALPGGVVLLGCYHVSQQNTFTGRLTEAMFDAVLGKASALVNASAISSSLRP
jgi:uracil-DNA glycosylase family 4